MPSTSPITPAISSRVHSLCEVPLRQAPVVVRDRQPGPDVPVTLSPPTDFVSPPPMYGIYVRHSTKSLAGQLATRLPRGNNKVTAARDFALQLPEHCFLFQGQGGSSAEAQRAAADRAGRVRDADRGRGRCGGGGAAGRPARGGEGPGAGAGAAGAGGGRRRRGAVPTGADRDERKRTSRRRQVRLCPSRAGHTGKIDARQFRV